MLATIERTTSRRLDPILIGTDELCSRWAHDAYDYAGGQAGVLWKAMREREGASLPGGPDIIADDVVELDRILASSEPRYLALVTVWYCQGGSVEQKAKRIHTDRANIYRLWHRTLEYLRGRLNAVGISV